MFERILVPLDGSDLAETALAPASELAKRFHSDVILLHVSPRTLRPGTEERLRVETYLESLRRRFEGDDSRVRTMLVTAKDAGEQIVKLARSQDVTAIVMSTHGQTGRRAVGPGSVASKVLVQSPVSVLFTRPSEYRPVQG